MIPLTDRQTQVFTFIQQHIAETGWPPSRAEIAKKFRFRSNNAANDHLKKIAKKGWIELVPGINRGIKICQ